MRPDASWVRGAGRLGAGRPRAPGHPSAPAQHPAAPNLSMPFFMITLRCPCSVFTGASLEDLLVECIIQAGLQRSQKSVGHQHWHTWHARALALKQASISSRLAARAFLCSVSCFSAAKSAALSENSTAHDHASIHPLLQSHLLSGHSQSSCQQISIVTLYTHHA